MIEETELEKKLNRRGINDYVTLGVVIFSSVGLRGFSEEISNYLPGSAEGYKELGEIAYHMSVGFAIGYRRKDKE